MESVELEVDLVRLIRQDTHDIQYILYILYILWDFFSLFFLSIPFFEHLNWFLKWYWFPPALSNHRLLNPKDTTPRQNSLWRYLPAWTKRRKKTFSEIFILKALGFVPFPAFRTPTDLCFCKFALPTVLLGENQQHSNAGALCSTIYLAYFGTRHQREKTAYLSARCLHAWKKKVKTRKLQNIQCTNEVVTTSAPPTDLDQQLHWLTGVRWGCGRESSPRVVWIPSVLGLEK